jgi:hypothetical protein
MAGRTALVKSVLASQAIYHLTPLAIPPGTLKFINKVERAFLWAAKETTSGAKCKVNWEAVCRPKALGGLGILHMDKFSTALRLRWPWLEWTDPKKIWAGYGNPCSVEDMNIFYAATIITLGNGCKTSFWHAPWLHGRAPKDIAPKLFESSKRKKWKVSQALLNDAWLSKIDWGMVLDGELISQFVELSQLTNNVHLQHDLEDTIVWKLTKDGHYTAASAYKLQFFGLIHSEMNNVVWKAWAPPKCKNHAWLALQNRLWTADRLEKRGWPNCGLCPLCKQTMESANHLFVHCRFTRRIWELLKEWIGLHGIHPRQWSGLSINEWWTMLAAGSSPNRKALASLALLTVWEVWLERNSRVFHNKLSPSFVVVNKIKEEARLWVFAGAKKLGSIMPGE